MRKEYQVMTNSPRCELQLAVNDYWKRSGRITDVAGNEPFERPFCACLFLHSRHSADLPMRDSRPQCAECDAQCLVPFGINNTPRLLIFLLLAGVPFPIRRIKCITLNLLNSNLFWLDLKKIDFSPKAGVKKLSLTKGEIYAGDAVKDLKDSQSFTFLFETPVM